MISFTQTDPWQPYEKGNKPAPVPEPGAYGAILFLVIAGIVIARRFRSRH